MSAGGNYWDNNPGGLGRKTDEAHSDSLSDENSSCLLEIHIRHGNLDFYLSTRERAEVLMKRSVEGF